MATGTGKTTIGIIGLGNFGHFAAATMAKDGDLEVIAYDNRSIGVPEGVQKVSLDEIAKADIVLLCVPLAAYAQVLVALRPTLRSDTLVVDVCSVKVEAERRLRADLPEHKNLLITHPMFGPQSAVSGTAGHTLIVTGAYGDKAATAIRYCQERLGLVIKRMTSDEHDRIMADVHALTFFVARGLAEYGLKESPFQAPSFKMLLDLVAFDASHTESLFRTIETGNPYARSAREKFMRTLESINRQLGKEKL